MLLCRLGRDPTQKTRAWSRSSRGLTCRLQRLHGDWGAASRAGERALDGSDLDEAAASAGGNAVVGLRNAFWGCPVLLSRGGGERRAVELLEEEEKSGRE